MSDHARSDDRLLQRVRTLFAAGHGTYGSPRIHALLQRQGVRVSRKRVARLMRLHGLKARANRVYRRNPGARVFSWTIPNRQLERRVTGPNQVWVGDVTYLHVGGVWRFLAVLLDKYSRRVVGWRLGKQRTLDLTVGALDDAVRARRPERGLVFHSDHGMEYAAYAYRDRLTHHGMVQSMNRPGGMGDNAHMESFFHSLKSDIYHGLRFDHDDDLRLAVSTYIRRYNRTRLHSALGYQSPIDYERQAA